MTTDKDGGAAFPRNILFSDGGVEVNDGMSLRDYFAAAAMQAVAPQLAADLGMEGLAALCYEAADAMLAARTKGEG